MDNKFTFDEELHQYKLDGVVIPSVTQVLQGVGIIDLSGIPANRLEAARLFGIAAHKATALSDKGTLDEENLDKNLRPYLEGWKLFRQEYGFTPDLIERAVYSEIYRVAGTPDRIGKWRIDSSIIIPDIKTGFALSSANAIQLAGYELIFRDNLYKFIFTKALKSKIKIKRLSVLLNDKGRYKIQEYKNKNDTNVFLSALSVYNFKEKNK